MEKKEFCLVFLLVAASFAVKAGLVAFNLLPVWGSDFEHYVFASLAHEWGNNPPIAYLFLISFSAVGATLGFKLAGAFVTSLIAAPAYGIVKEVTGSVPAAFATAFLTVFSYASIPLMNGNFKNGLGLFFALYVILALVRFLKKEKEAPLMDAVACCGFICLLALTHYSTAAWLFMPLGAFMLLRLFASHPKQDFYTLAILGIIIAMSLMAMRAAGSGWINSNLSDNLYGYGGYGLADFTPLFWEWLAVFLPFLMAFENMRRTSFKLFFGLWSLSSILLATPLFVAVWYGFYRFVYLDYFVLYIIAGIGMASDKHRKALLPYACFLFFLNAMQIIYFWQVVFHAYF